MKKYLISALIALTAISASAQKDISKQMEVTKAYTPKVGRAAKLPLEPRMTDTVRLRPEIGYSITPAAWQTVFETPKFRPAAISVALYEKTRPFYLRAGAGYPFQTTADLYINPYMGNRSSFGLFFNHRGSYSKIMNELGVKPNSTEMFNGAGLYGSKFFRRYKLEGDVGYDHRVYNAYGVSPEDLFAFPGNDPGIGSVSFSPMNAVKLGQVRGKIVFGDTFEDLGRFNFQVGINLGAAHGSMPYSNVYQGLLPRVSGFYQIDIDAWARIAKMFNQRHGLEIGLYERGVVGLGDFSESGSVTVMLRPRYLLSLEKLALSAGIDINYVKNNAFRQDYMSFVPQFDLRLKIAKGYFSPYLKLISHPDDGSFEALTRVVPFVRKAAATGWTHDLRFGFSGSAGDVFSYHVYGGASKLQDHAVFTGYQFIAHDGNGNASFDPMWFRPLRDDGMRYVVGAELGLSNLRGFSAKLAANRYWENMDNLPSGNLPAWDANVELGYSYKDKFTITAGAKVLGDRNNFNYGIYSAGMNLLKETASNTLPAVVDVFAGVEVKLFNGFDLFIEGRNLANQKLWPWNYYRGAGANVMTGIKIVF